MEKSYILSAVRTAIGTFGGSLKDVAPQELGGLVIKDAVRRVGCEPSQVEEIVMGCVGQFGIDAYMARSCALDAGIPPEATALTVNRLCGSGLQAINQAVMTIRTGQAGIVAAGGVESMSRYPYLDRATRWGSKYGDIKQADALDEVLSCPANHYAMGCTAQNVAERWRIRREEQDRFAAESQQKAVKAVAEGLFAGQTVPVDIPGRKGETHRFDKDEAPRPDVSLERLARLKPAFRPEGTVTAGNSCGINDGAAATVVASQSRVEELGVQPLAEVVDFAIAGVDPDVMGIGPVPAVRKLIDKTGVSLREVSVIELNEAFAAQCLAVGRELEPVGWDWEKVNPNGGAISLGHPVGATGSILATKLLSELEWIQGEYGIVTMCIGGGQGIATLFRLLP